VSLVLVLVLPFVPVALLLVPAKEILRGVMGLFV
jgi:hypothetical protein